MPGKQTPGILFGSRTDIGCQRERNEDSLAVNPPLFVVADGMGGHKAGDVASEVAVNTMAALAPRKADVDLLGRAMEAANHAVITEAGKAGREGMGTTMTACVVQGEKLAIAHVGDSRAYLLHAGKLQQVTRDHSLVADLVEQGRLTPEEARVHPKRSVITRALGSDPHMQPDLYEITASAGDRLLLCSDGLHGMVDDGVIQAGLARIRDPQRCAAALVNEAIAAGGADNITVIVVDISGDGARIERRERWRGRTWMAVVLLVLVGILGGTAYGVYSWVHSAAFLGVQDGKVVIYQGIPESLPGIETHWLYRQTDVSLDTLQPSAQGHIQAGLQVDNLEAAESLVEEYERQVREAAGEEEAKAKKASGKSGSSGKAAASNDSESEGSEASGSEPEAPEAEGSEGEGQPENAGPDAASEGQND